jgi:hypothetical protein
MQIYVKLFPVEILSSPPCSLRRPLYLRIKVTAVYILFPILDAIMVTVLILTMCSLIADTSLTVRNKISTVVTLPSTLLLQSFWLGLRYVCPSCSLSAISRLRSKFTFKLIVCNPVHSLFPRKNRLRQTMESHFTSIQHSVNTNPPHAVLSLSNTTSHKHLCRAAVKQYHYVTHSTDLVIFKTRFKDCLRRILYSTNSVVVTALRY